MAAAEHTRRQKSQRPNVLKRMFPASMKPYIHIHKCTGKRNGKTFTARIVLFLVLFPINKCVVDSVAWCGVISCISQGFTVPAHLLLVPITEALGHYAVLCKGPQYTALCTGLIIMQQQKKLPGHGWKLIPLSRA